MQRQSNRQTHFPLIAGTFFLGFLFAGNLYKSHCGSPVRFAIDLQTVQNLASIKGKITETNGDPLQFASVFIANSTLGCITDMKGGFILEKVPYGRHLLVVSFVGFEAEKRSLNVDKGVIELNVEMKPLPQEMVEVKVTADKSKNKWKTNFNKFRNFFIGTTPNADECEILNPEVLRFHYDKKSKILTADANEIVIIKNRALGYRIQYLLELFELRRDGSCIYLGEEKFEPMEPENSGEVLKWQQNRKDSYHGSFRHFLTSLAQDSLDQEGFFAARSVSVVPRYVQDDILPESEKQKSVAGYDLISFRTAEYERLFLYTPSYIHVIYFHEQENYKYKELHGPNYKSQPFQQSWMKFLKLGAIFHVDGYLYDPTDVMVFGYWSWEKMAEALPKDYYPAH